VEGTHDCFEVTVLKTGFVTGLGRLKIFYVAAVAGGRQGEERCAEEGPGVPEHAAPV
jgi:hypothetical protein